MYNEWEEKSGWEIACPMQFERQSIHDIGLYMGSHWQLVKFES